ncbi:MAG: sulfatase-like hydrolase/transferase [Cyclobacteriaceae bacterium]
MKITTALILIALSTPVFSQEPTVDQMPNIVFILVDDLGREAVGAYGGTSYKTPQIDRLAASGAQFDHGYAYPLCTNTRVSLMTGKYNVRNWKAFGILDPEETTLGHMFQNEGYKTLMVGKWQLQSYDPKHFPGSELRRNTGMKVDDAGFDEYSMWHTSHTEEKGSRFSDPIIYQNGQFLDNTHDKYGPDIFTDYLLDFMERNQEKPFFAYYPMALTHDPFVPTPDSEEWPDRTLRHKQENKYFGDMVEYCDKTVGRIVQKLQDLNLRENTLLIFYSDNGTHQTIYSMMGDEKIQGAKGKEIDAGTRIPLIINWPGTIKPQINSEFVAPSDFIPTMFEAIGRSMPSGSFTDGESFFGSLIGKVSNRRDWVYIDHDPRPGSDKNQFKPRRFVRGTKYKLYDDGLFVEPDVDPLEEQHITPQTQEQKEIAKRYGDILDSLSRYRTFGKLIKLEPSFDDIVSPSTKIEVIGEGFTWVEGPVWVESEQALLFSDVPRNTIYKWTNANGIEIFLEKSGYTGSKPRTGGKGSNGLTVDNEGKLILCRQGDREIARLTSSYKTPVPAFEAIVTHYQGKRISSPNDVTVDKAGNIYFTDPMYGIDKDLLPAAKELDFNGVYRYNTDGSLDLLIKDLPNPNGIGISPDGSKMYIANSGPGIMYEYDLNSKKLPLKGKVFFDFTKYVTESISQQEPDGFDINEDGIVFLAGPDGVMVISPEGEHLGTIYTGKRTSNCVLNEDETVLYATVDDYVVRIVMDYKVGSKYQ